MVRDIKLATLRLLKRGGIFNLVADSRWRRQRLLVLCYHGVSLADEHRWRPGLYMEASVLEQRFEMLKNLNYNVLPLGESLEKLGTGSLPTRSVAITFDDGTYDFYKQAYPIAKKYGFPVTVYLTTYYSDLQRPVFNLITSYMLWQKRGQVIQDARELGLNSPLDLRTEAARHGIVMSLMELAHREALTGSEKDLLAARLAEFLGIDYKALIAKRLLQIMNARELKEVSEGGIDVQLHTHRHRTPEDEVLFRREIHENRERIQALVSKSATHFCYPSGVYRPMFLRWLAQEQVISATTCDAGLATRESKMLLIPRYVDTQVRAEIDFESWISGVGDLLAIRRAGGKKYVPYETES
jgi:peptidoglycan/xylan/chitin deacetylase (PgdA/CDA1 family)